MRLIARILGIGMAALLTSGSFAGSVAWKNRIPKERAGATLAYDSSRHAALMFGGQDRTSALITYLNDTWTWDGSTWIKRNVPGPSARSFYAMAYDASRGVTVLFGGKNGSVLNNETWEWNGVKWTQRVVAGPSARSGASMCFDSTRNVIVLFGGFTTTYLGDTWEWDGTTWTQRAVTGPAPRTGSAFVYDSVRGHAVLACGLRGSPVNGTPFLANDTWKWDGTAWTQLAVTGPQAVQYTAAGFDSSRGVMVLFGGGSTTSGFGTPSSQTWEWDGTVWTNRGNGFGRVAHAMAYMPENGGVLLFGGLPTGSSGTTLNGDLQTWNGSAWSNLVVHGPSARTLPAMAYDSVRGKTVVSTGYNESGGGFVAVADTWDWDGVSWLQRTTGPQPFMTSMAFDAAHGEHIYFGGVEGASTLSARTYKWSGGVGGWLNLNVSGPSARRYPSMTYDSARHVIVLFGGWIDDFATPIGDTWEWDGTAWTQRVVSGPSARYGAAMAYDSARGVTVLYGGSVQSGVGSNETWEWDGTAWTQRLGPNPGSQRIGCAMAYDSTRAKTVLFGGYQSAGDTWEWDGTAWTQLSIPGPTATIQPGMVYDPVRKVMVLYGGSNPGLGGGYSSLTWELVIACPGDLNADDVVDDADFVLFASAYDMLDCADPAMPLTCPSDLNGDLVVDDADFVLFAQGYDTLVCY